MTVKEIMSLADNFASLHRHSTNADSSRARSILLAAVEAQESQEPVNQMLLAALKYLLGPSHNENVGWRGIHGTETVFDCEFCGRRHEDCTLIAHLDGCPVAKARAAIAAAQEVGK